MTAGFLFVWSSNRTVRLESAVTELTRVDGSDHWFVAASPGYRHGSAGDGWALTRGIEHENGDGLYVRISRTNPPGLVNFRTDAMPSQRVFWWKQEGQLVVASSLILVLTVGRDLGFPIALDTRALGELLTASYVYSPDRTPIQGIRSLGHGQELSVDVKDGSFVVSDWLTPFVYDPNPSSWDESVRSLRAAMETGLKRFTGARVAVLLSGGADSRINAAAARGAGLEPEFFTFGQSAANMSDFRVATAVASELGTSTTMFSTNSDIFRQNWKRFSEISNWSNDGLWSTARIPEDFWEQLEDFDVVIRGDGDGVYGWRGHTASTTDILHQMEITPPETAARFGDVFVDGVGPLVESARSHAEAVKRLETRSEDLTELKNIVYHEIREPYGIGPVAGMYADRLIIDTPLLWQESLAVARRLPKNRRTNKQVIYGVLDTYGPVARIPYSSGPSWNDRLEHLVTGVWEELIGYVDEWSPWPIDTENLGNRYLNQPGLPVDPSMISGIKSGVRQKLSQTWAGRRIGFKFFGAQAGTSMSERILIRLAIASSLNEEITRVTWPKVIHVASKLSEQRNS